MRGTGTILARELRGYFNSVIAYVFIIVFLLVSCGLFMTTFFLQGTADMRSFFTTLPFVLLVFLPAVTMRLWAEERSHKTDELLLTCPIRTPALVVGKFLAALVFFLCALAGTLVLPIMLAWLGDPDGGALASAYLGTILLGAFLLGLGLFLSGLARDQIVAFVLSLAVGFALFLAGTPFVAGQIDGWVPGLGTLLSRAFGLAERYEDFTRGVVPLDGVFFFLAGTVLFLALNGMLVERRGRSRLEPVFAGGFALTAVLAILAVLVVSTFRGARADWTEDDVFTISGATREILADLEDRVVLTYYVSPEDKMPTMMKALGRDVRDKLEEIADASDGKVEVRVLDPTDPDVAEKAEEAGVQPFQVQSMEQDELSVKLVYSSLVISYLEDDEVLPQVSPLNFPNLEYELVSRIYRLLRDEPPMLALSGAREGLDPQMAQIYQQMGRPVPPPREIYGQVEQFLREAGEYRIQKVDLAAGDEIPENADTLVILEPKGFDQAARSRIAAFLRRGGSVILALQARTYQYQPAGNRGIQVTPQENPPSGVEELLADLGVTVRDEILMDVEQEMLSIPTRTRFGGFNAVMDTPVQVPVQIQVVRDRLDRSAPAVGMTTSLLYLWGSGLELDDAKLDALGLDHEVLFTTTDNAWFVEPDGPLTPEQVDPDEHESAGPVALAVLLRGTFPAPPATAEEAEEPQSANGEETAASSPADAEASDTTTNEDAAEPAGEGRLLVVGSARMFSDGILGAHDNGLLLVNAVDTLTLGPELVDIRGKSLKPRTFETPQGGAKLWWRFFAVGMVPLLVALVGIARAMLRRRAREQYRREVLRPAA